MRVTEISHRRIRNLGSFESAEVTLTASLDEDDDVKDVLKELKDQAKKFLYPEKYQNGK